MDKVTGDFLLKKGEKYKKMGLTDAGQSILLG